MGIPISKPKKQQVKKAVGREYPFQPGDFLLKERDGTYLRVSKVNKDGFTTEYFNGEEWRSWGSPKWGEAGGYVKLDKSLEECEAEMFREMAGGWASFDPQESSGRDVALTSGADAARSAKAALESVNKKLAMMQALMERQKNELYSLKRHYEGQLEQVQRVVDIIELYLGVSEEVVQIGEGEPAPVEDPICFRQLCLHMDEEAADLFTGEVDGRGRHVDDIDFTNIEVFDKWAREHADQLLPESKGLVVCRPRRTEKDYRLGDDPLAAFTASEMNRENFRTYFLIRNGENLYRISSEKVHVYPVLFPSKEEFAKLTKVTGYSEDERNKEKLLAYQRNVLMLQGLLDRTNIFKPHPAGLNLLKPETFGDSVKFIHDGESLLGTGRPDFWKWLEQLNCKIQRGHRLYFTKFPSGEFRYDNRDDRTQLLMRFPIPGWDSHRPPRGVYNVVRLEPYERRYHSESSPSFICQFKPNDEVYTRKLRFSGRIVHDPHERKMSIPFRLFADDHFVINYEDLQADDVEFYIKDRVSRREYLEMIPILRGIMVAKAEEAEWERNFVQFMCGKFKRQDDEFEKLVTEAIAWFKQKVIMKRPLRKEDAKAVRMIEARIKRQLR